MCGRFAVFYSNNELKKIFNIKFPEMMTNYNISPLTDVLIVNNDSYNRLTYNYMRWGLIPSWIKDPSSFKGFINARSETLNMKPSFKKCFQSRRCIVPVSGFYEWDKQVRQPYFFSNNKILYLAGIWDECSVNERNIKSFAIVTGGANVEFAKIHDRMPLILNYEDSLKWIDNSTKQSVLYDIIRFNKVNELTYHKISKRVNNPVNNSNDIIDMI